MKTLAHSFLALTVFLLASCIGARSIEAAADELVVVMRSDTSLQSEQIPDQSFRADDPDSLKKLKEFVGNRSVILLVESDAPAESVRKVTELLSSPEHRLKISEISPEEHVATESSDRLTGSTQRQVVDDAKAKSREHYSTLFDQRQAAQLQKIETQMRKLEALKKKIELRATRKAEIIAKQLERRSSRPVQNSSTSKSQPIAPNASATTTSLLRQNDVAIAKLNLERALRKLSKLEQLRKENLASETELQNATFDARQAELELNRAVILVEDADRSTERAQVNSAFSRAQPGIGSTQSSAKESVALRRHDVEVAELDLERALKKLSLYEKAGRGVPGIELNDAEYEVRKAELGLSRAKTLLEEAEHKNSSTNDEAMENARREKIQLILENQLKQAEVLLRHQEKLVKNIATRFAAGACTEDELIKAKAKQEIAALEYDRIRVLWQAHRTGIELVTTINPIGLGSKRSFFDETDQSEAQRKLSQSTELLASDIQELAEQEKALIRQLKYQVNYQGMDQKERDRLEADLEHIRRSIVRLTELKLHATHEQGQAKRAELQRKVEEELTALDEDLLRSKNLGIEIRRKLEKYHDVLDARAKAQDASAASAGEESPNEILRELGLTMIALKMEIRTLTEQEKVMSVMLESDEMDPNQRSLALDQLARVREQIKQLTKQQIHAAKKAAAAKKARLKMQADLLRIDRTNADTRLKQSLEAINRIKQKANPSDAELDQLEEARARIEEFHKEIEGIDSQLKVLEVESNSRANPSGDGVASPDK